MLGPNDVPRTGAEQPARERDDSERTEQARAPIGSNDQDVELIDARLYEALGCVDEKEMK